MSLERKEEKGFTDELRNISPLANNTKQGRRISLKPSERYTNMFNKKAKILIAAALLLLTVTLTGCSLDTPASPSTSIVPSAPNATDTPQTPIKSTAKEIDFKEYTTVRFEGYDGSGFVHIDVDFGSITDLFMDENFTTIYDISNNFKVSKEENDGKLSNGDKITVRINYNKEGFDKINTKAVNADMEFEVSGLEEKEVLDIFKDVELVVAEVAIPSVSDVCVGAYVKYNGDNSKIGGQLDGIFSNSFKITDINGEQPSYYKEGDTVIVSIADSVIKNFETKKSLTRYKFLETSREYVLEINR